MLTKLLCVNLAEKFSAVNLVNSSVLIQSTLDKWNLHGTKKNGSTYRMFHLSELLDKWNLYETEKKVPLIELLSYLKSQETEGFMNNQKQGEEEKKMLYRYLCST